MLHCRVSVDISIWPCYSSLVMDNMSSQGNLVLINNQNKVQQKWLNTCKYMHKDKEITQMEMLYGKEKTRDSFPHWLKHAKSSVFFLLNLSRRSLIFLKPLFEVKTCPITIIISLTISYLLMRFLIFWGKRKGGNIALGLSKLTWVRLMIGWIGSSWELFWLLWTSVTIGSLGLRSVLPQFITLSLSVVTSQNPSSPQKVSDRVIPYPPICSWCVPTFSLWHSWKLKAKIGLMGLNLEGMGVPLPTSSLRMILFSSLNKTTTPYPLSRTS